MLSRFRTWLSRPGSERVRTAQTSPPVNRSVGMLPATRPASAVISDDVDLSALIGIILRQWWFILIWLVIALGAAFAYLAMTDPTWRATSRVLVDPREKQLVGNGLVTPVQGTDPVWLETQADLVASEATLAAVVRTEDLQNDPEFGGDGFAGTLKKLSDAVLVERPNATYVLNVHVTSLDPAKASRLSRAVAAAFVESLSAVKSESARQANQLLTRQLETLREEARAADEALQAFKRENGFVAAEGRLVDEATLNQINKSYVEARLAADSARERRDRIRAILRSGATSIDSQLDSMTSAVISRLRIEVALAEKRIADLAEQLGPNHPRMISARADMERTRGLLVSELRALGETAAADYELAAAREASVRASLESATGNLNRIGEAGVRLRELENEASAKTEVYRAFVSRVAETGPQPEVQISDARVIEAAPVPDAPYTPRKTLVLALALIAGGGIGVSGALYRGRADLLGGRASRDYDQDTMAPPDLHPASVVHPIGVSELASASVADRVERGPSEYVLGRNRIRSPAAVAGRANPLSRVPAAGTSASNDHEVSTVGPDEPADPLSILAEIEVNTAPEQLSRRGRRLARSMRSIIGSAVEDGAGLPVPGRLHGLGRRLGALPLTAGGPPVLLVQGLGDPAAVAAATFAVARSLSETLGDILLVDLATDEFPIAEALGATQATTLRDVLEGLADAPDLVAIDGRMRLVTLGPASAEAVDAVAVSVVELVAELARRHNVTVIHLGDSLSAGLLAALGGRAGASILAATQASLNDPEEKTIALDVTAVLPGFAGTIVVADRARRGRAAA